MGIAKERYALDRSGTGRALERRLTMQPTRRRRKRGGASRSLF
jgi:hypothetical protein